MTDSQRNGSDGVVMRLYGHLATTTTKKKTITHFCWKYRLVSELYKALYGAAAAGIEVCGMLGYYTAVRSPWMS